MSNNLTVSEPQNIQSPPGNSLAIFLDKNGTLQAKDVIGNVYPLSNYLPSGGGGTPTLPDVFLGYIQRSIRLGDILDNYNLTVEEGTIPVLFVTSLPVGGSQAVSQRYLWKLGAGNFFPIGGSDIESKLELIQEAFTSSNDLVIILNDPNAQEVPLGIISEDFITYMNTHGPYVFTDVNKTYVVTFTQDDIDYAYIFQGTLGTYGAGNSQFFPDDFIFIYQSTNAGEPTNSTYIRITRSEAIVLQATSSFVPGAIYVITDADVNLYGGTEITLTAITSNQLSLQGSGKFYCPKYDVSAESTGYGIWTTYMEGTFSNIVGGFTSGEMITDQNGAEAIYLAEGFLNYVSGDWSLAVNVFGASGAADVSGFVSPSYTVGQIAHWGGKSWTNNNGNIGASIDKYTLDAEWTEIPFNEIDYNVYIDEIQYDFGNDMIIYRKDRYNNVVSGNNQVFVEFESPDGYGYGNPIKDFQWGCYQDDYNTNDYFYLGIQGNEVIDSYFETLNTRGKYIWFNKLSQISYIYNTTLSSNSFIQINTLSISSYIESNTFSRFSKIQYITLSSSSSIQNSTFSSFSNIQYITLSRSRLYFPDEVVNKTLSNLEIRNSNLSIPNTAKIIFVANLSKTIFNRLDGTPRLQYVNNSDVTVITDVDA